jgi:lipopolysaccharide/colanic/teichoic acid biosynthesis glycosyltransferase
MHFQFGDQTSALDESLLENDALEYRPGAGDYSLKRLFDVVSASLLLVLVAPLLILAALAIRLQDGEKAIYAQTRYGLNGRAFACLKLRSMVPNAAEKLQAVLDSDPEARREWELTQKLTNDPRVTRVGKFLRATSIDELPQLINIIRGDMSVVGPRPIQFSEFAKYGDDLAHYCSVRPGLTGLWQVSGRSNIGYPERVAMDKRYVQTQSFWGDLKIIFRTIPAVLASEGAK